MTATEADQLLERARAFAFDVQQACGSADLLHRKAEVPEAHDLRVWDVARLTRKAWDQVRMPDFERYVASVGERAE